MARTRSSLGASQETAPSEISPASTNSLQLDDEPPPPASFKGQLSRFQYTSTSTSITSKKTAPAPSTFPATSTLKRLRSTPPKTTSPTQSPRPKKKRKPSTYAPPSKYAHLPPLTDILEPNLITVFIGTNPGIKTSTTGHAYAHPSNLFWKLLHSSGLTPDRRLSPTEDVDLPRLYCMGNTNIVARPSKDAAELSREEMCAGARVLEEKMARWRPESVCIVGKGIWEAVWRSRYGRGFGKGEFEYGWQDERENMGKVVGEQGKGGEDGWKGARVFAATSTSGLAAGLRPKEKEEIWRPFGEWVQMRREERGFRPRGKDGEVLGES